MSFFRRSNATDTPALETQSLLREVARAEIARLTAMLYARDTDVMRLQREVDDLTLGALGRLVGITQRRDAERLAGRDRRGQFKGHAA